MPRYESYRGYEQDKESDGSQQGQQQCVNGDDNGNSYADARGVENEQEAPNSSNVTISGDLEDSDLHEGGTIFSKKLLTQLFSGPGDHDPNEEEVPVHQVQHEHVKTAGSGEWTIVELKAQNANGADLILEAKMDSGADDNFMSYQMWEVTGLGFIPYEGPEGPSFTMGGGQQSQPLGQVRLEYTAGIEPRKFIETFQVLQGLPHDVLIGKPLMTGAHMMMVDPNFAHPPQHRDFCLLELRPKDKDSIAKAEAFQRQRREEQIAYREAERKEEGGAEGEAEEGLE